jgi:hypothetical protein
MKTVPLDMAPASFAFWGIRMKYVVELGAFEIMVGGPSRDSGWQKLSWP